MGKLIAVAGKGGTGKTTVAALIIKHLLEIGRTPVLAVDADPNYTLGEALGVEVETTIGTMREDFIGERAQIPAGMSKEAVLERKMHAALHERKGFDLLVMGRQEGPGCYCYLNNILRKFMDILANDYPVVVIDNEAGMEHLSRRTTKKIDLLLVVCDHSVKAAKAAGRIVDLIDELKLVVKEKILVLNRATGQISKEVQAEIERSGLETVVRLPEDSTIAEVDTQGRALLAVPEKLQAMESLIRGLEPVFEKL